MKGASSPKSDRVVGLALPETVAVPRGPESESQYEKPNPGEQNDGMLAKIEEEPQDQACSK